MVVAQQPTEALSTHHEPTLMLHAGLWDDELVPKTLVISLVVVMGQVRLDHRAEGGLADHDHLIKGFVFDRADEPLAIGIEIRAPWRQDDRAPPRWREVSGRSHPEISCRDRESDTAYPGGSHPRDPSVAGRTAS